MALLSDIVSRVRLELNDTPQAFSQTFIGDGVTTVFQLDKYPVDASLVQAYVNTALVSNTNVTVNEQTGSITFAIAPAAAATILITGTAYRYFCTNDLNTITQSAADQHFYGRVDAFQRPLSLNIMPSIELYPVSLWATIQALHALATDAAYDIDISAPDGVTVPRSERYRQLIDQINVRRDQYRELCEVLNIGIYKTEVYQLRRVSTATGRYVPLYLPQEIDDPTIWQRVYLPLPTLGATAVPTTAGQFDIITKQGDTYQESLQFSFDLSNYTIAAQVRNYPQSPILAATINVQVVNATAGQVVMSLTSAQTTTLPLRGYWDLQVTDNSSGAISTLVEGMVFVTPQVTR